MTRAPSLRLYVDRRTARPHWIVDIRFPSGARQRIAIGCPADDDPAPIFEAWKQNVLPSLLEADAAETVEAPPRERSDAPSTVQNLRQIFAWYVEVYLPAGDRSEKTIARYTQMLDDFLLFARARHIGRPQQLSPDTLRQWQAWMQEHRPPRAGGKRSTATRRDELLVLRRCLTTAVAEGRIDKLPFEIWNIPRARPGTRYRAHTLELLHEVLNLVRAERPRIAPIVEWLAVTGWSPEDAVGLTWDRLDVQRRRKDVQRLKTGVYYPRIMTDAEAGILEPLTTDAKPHGLVFALPGATHKARTQYLHKHLSRLTEKHLGVRIIPRDIRKTFGTLHANGSFGVPTNPKELQYLMAHSSLETTMTFYTEVTDTQLAAAATRGAVAILGPPSAARG